MPQVVDRHLQNWRRAGVLQRHGFRHQIADLEALRQRAGEVIVAARQPCDGGAVKK